MHTPASSAAPSPTFQSLSSQQPSSTPPISHNVPTSISSSPPSLRDTTSATNTRSADQTQPSIPSTPSSAAEQHSASPTPSMAGTYTVASSAASQPSLLPSNGPTTDVRQAVDGTDAPIDLRGLSTLPSGHALPVSTAMLGAPRTINLPTLKNPQGELLDLNELAGFGDGLTPTQENFSMHSPPPTTTPHAAPHLQSFAKSPPATVNTMSPAFGGSTFHCQATCLSPPMLSPDPSLASFPSVPSLASIPSLLSSLASTPSMACHPSPSMGSDNGSINDGLKTPNVYINGLPPNFPEEDLLAMTKPFGEVVSVRTFTRHVSDKPSGYGFVLFGSVDAAERCIESLRKYRNLHPSFSKQVHKIPGTSYAAAHADAALNAPPRSDEHSDTFKSKMERLKDPNSTNLYMEGLPLSIDDATLQALVSPYRIMSSRFFRTRLSNPPRIIAFVRLESREAAEDIIERLHGRMVRGWCDAGSRISVRFADTSEQRELRVSRVERVNRDDENSPARLTMAQAALLNLKGTQMNNPAESRLTSPNFGIASLPPVIGASPIVDPAFVATSDGYRSLPPPIGLHHQSSVEPPTLRGTNGLSYDGSALGIASLDARAGSIVPPGYGASDLDLLQMSMAGMDMGVRPPVATRAQNGFTPMERLILQAHEQRQQQEAMAVATGGAFVQTRGGNGVGQGRAGKGLRTSEFNPSATEFNPSMTGLGRQNNSVATSPALSDGGDERRRLVDFLPAMSEQDFHARAQQKAMQKPESKTLRLDQESRVQFTRQRNQTHAEAKAQAEAEARATHARSTTVPSHYLNTDISRSLSSDSHSGTNMNTSTLGGNAQARRNITNARDLSSLTHSRPTNTSNSVRNVGQRLGGGFRNTNIPTSTTNVHPKHNVDAASQQQNAHTRIDTGRSTTRSRPSTSHGDSEDDGSGLDSPALSYSARTPASLSPATPFSAFGETFDGPSIASGDVGLGVGVGGAKDMAGMAASKGMAPNVRNVHTEASATVHA